MAFRGAPRGVFFFHKQLCSDSLLHIHGHVQEEVFAVLQEEVSEAAEDPPPEEASLAAGVEVVALVAAVVDMLMLGLQTM